MEAGQVRRPRRRPTRSFAPVELLVPAAIALLISLILFRNGITHLRSHVFGVAGDSELFVWSFRWVPWAISHGVYPLTSHVVFSTTGGINLAHNTFAPLGAIVLWPVTALFGPVLSYNLYALSAPMLDAVAGFIVLRPHLRRGPATFGSMLFAFSPLAYTASEGHPQVNHIWAATIGIALIVRALDSDDPRTRRRQSIGGGVLLALQLYMGIEMLALAALLVVASGLVLASLDAEFRARAATQLRRAPAALAPGVVAFAILGAPFIATWLFGPERFFKIHQFQDVTSADLANFIVPSRATFFNGPTFVSRPPVVPFLGGERAAYIGFALVAVILYLTIRKWREFSGFFRFAVVSFWTGSLLALGAELQIWGKNTHITLPWAILVKTPILRSALPTRLPIFTALAVGALLAWMLENARSPTIPGVWKATAVIGVLMIIPGEAPTSFGVPTEQAAKALASFCGKDAEVLTVPRLYAHHAMLIQAQSNFSFHLVRAFGFRKSSSEFGDVVALDGESGVQPDTAGIAQARQELQHLGATCVVALDSTLAVWTVPPDLNRLAGFFGRPCTRIGADCAWRLDGGP